MNDLNTVLLVGRLTKDMELSYTGGGLAIGTFSLAVNRSVKHGNEWQSLASFFYCKCFGKTAENLQQYMAKGKQVAVIGELVQERWEKEGQKFSKISIMADNIQLLGGGTNNSASPEEFEDVPF